MFSETFLYNFHHFILNSKIKQLAQNIFTFLSSVPSSVSCKSCIVACGPKWLFLFQSSQKRSSLTVWIWSGNDILVSDSSFYLLTTSPSDSSHHTIRLLQSLSSPPRETPHPTPPHSLIVLHSQCINFNFDYPHILLLWNLEVTVMQLNQLVLKQQEGKRSCENVRFTHDPRA